MKTVEIPSNATKKHLQMKLQSNATKKHQKEIQSNATKKQNLSNNCFIYKGSWVSGEKSLINAPQSTELIQSHDVIQKPLNPGAAILFI